MAKRLLSIGAIFAACTAVAWGAAYAFWPVPTAILVRMNQEQRLKYLQSLEPSDIVGYYCEGESLTDQARNDVETTLQNDFAVSSVVCVSDKQT